MQISFDLVVGGPAALHARGSARLVGARVGGPLVHRAAEHHPHLRPGRGGQALRGGGVRDEYFF